MTQVQIVRNYPKLSKFAKSAKCAQLCKAVQNCAKSARSAQLCKILQNVKHFAKCAKCCEFVQNVQNCAKCAKLAKKGAKLCKMFKIVSA